MERKQRRHNVTTRKIHLKLQALQEAGESHWLPWSHRSAAKSDTLSFEEWKEYRLRRALHHDQFPDYERGWRRPTAPTATETWTLLKSRLNLQVRELAPASYVRCLDEDNDRRALDVTTRQALLVVLDHFLTMGRRRRIVTLNSVFDALADRWSDHYRHAQKNGRVVAYDMKKDTVESSRRDLLRNGISVEALWQKATKPNVLYETEHILDAGYEVTIRDNTSLLAEFDKVVLRDSSYRRSTVDTSSVLRWDAPFPTRPARREICAERAYNEVLLGSRAEKLLAAQESARVFFNVPGFLADYERFKTEARDVERELSQKYEITAGKSTHRPDIWITMRDGRTVRLESPRERHIWTVWNTTKPDLTSAQQDAWWSTVHALLERYDDARDSVEQFKPVYEAATLLGSPMRSSPVIIKSQFTRTRNRRYQAEHFWPSAASADQEMRPGEGISASVRQRWFKAPLDQGTARDREATLGDQSWHDVPDDAFPIPQDFTEVDVSSSQTQILAVFLGLRELERIVCSPITLQGIWRSRVRGHVEYGFKNYLARCAWTINGARPILNDGYTGPADRRLVALVKELWMRTLYGSEVHEIVRDQLGKPRAFGPGWQHSHFKNKREFEAAAKEATPHARNFLLSINGYAEVDRFLRACQRIAKVADKYTGAVFVDPFDGTELRWDPVQRAPVHVPIGDHKVVVSLPGRYLDKAHKTFRAAIADAATRRYPVDRGELRRIIAPCLVHMMDAYFSALVMERLVDQGIQDFVAIHDCWLVPTFVPAPQRRSNRRPANEREAEWQDRQDRSGARVLADVVRDTGQEWLLGLRPIYDRLLHYLRTDPEYGPDVRRWHTQWEARVSERRWPQFVAVPPATELLPSLRERISFSDDLAAGQDDGTIGENEPR